MYKVKYKIKYKIDIIFVIISFIAANFTSNRIDSDSLVILAVMIILARDIKIRIDNKFDKSDKE